MKTSWKLLLITMTIIVILVSGCQPKKGTEENEEAINVEETSEETGTEIDSVNKYICPLTGIGVENEDDIKYRPVAVMIDNEKSARPQSGIGEADIVYEMPVEGNITRYMAVYHHTPTEKIGPVRSARPYFIDKALEFDAIYVHCGGSPQALKDIKSLKVDAFDDLSGTPAYWRSKDRKMPHNLYTSTKLIREVAQKKNLERDSAPKYFKFSNEFLAPDGGNGQKVVINYDKNYKISYIYNNDERVYYRQINGDNMKDKESLKEIKATNIIIEKVGVKVLDKAGRLELSNIGKGRGYLLTGGKLVEIEWSKSSRNGKTTYNNLNGEEITLNKGNTWIQVVSNNTKIEFGE
ncbi:DUF3048 domain-containing protein [Lutispora thermophila]|uniref:DUF3048 domain-containing protein n=1 Tax=Lutispora thermophila DSM 19022 TaxID=1122184 RepID=A0A1M6ESN7_9FIRM|nr:DUF3048 domain-containing protein [Lutispora thermophila]SHI88534.1 Protein of unknown function [Lutispora thermophila DSM 19022]